ncbi:hypothetical protein CgunFtcFv8_008974 [Champsocephalus gunnari]|nr:hypothetical protein CgunFtcFv8_008974 [Champsocephalus gunnari]
MCQLTSCGLGLKGFPGTSTMTSCPSKFPLDLFGFRLGGKPGSGADTEDETQHIKKQTADRRRGKEEFLRASVIVYTQISDTELEMGCRCFHIGLCWQESPKDGKL